MCRRNTVAKTGEKCTAMENLHQAQFLLFLLYRCITAQVPTVC